jgi:hypothetical protein
VLTENWSWKPEQLRLFYLAANTRISDTDALNLSGALQRVFNAALDDPRSVYPIKPRMEFVFRVATLFQEGEVRICS